MLNILVSSVSLCCDNKGQLYEPKTVPNPLKQKKNYMESISQQFKMFKYNNRVKIAKDEEITINDYFNNLEKYNSNYNYRVDEKSLLEHNFTSNKKEFLKNLIEDQRNANENYVKLLEDLQKLDKDPNLEKKEQKGKNNTSTDDKNLHENANNNKQKPSMNLNEVMKVSGSNKVLIFPSVNIKFELNNYIRMLSKI